MEQGKSSFTFCFWVLTSFLKDHEVKQPESKVDHPKEIFGSELIDEEDFLLESIKEQSRT